MAYLLWMSGLWNYSSNQMQLQNFSTICQLVRVELYSKPFHCDCCFFLSLSLILRIVHFLQHYLLDASIKSTALAQYPLHTFKVKEIFITNIIHVIVITISQYHPNISLHSPSCFDSDAEWQSWVIHPKSEILL